jgi:glycosyl hydrolase family 38
MLKKIFLVHHTHMDIGYTDLPLEVMDQQLNHLDRALSLCRQDDNFYWTIESAYLVRDYLRNRPEICKNELIHALKSGRMELQAFETQPLTELLSADELLNCVEYSVELGKTYGFEVKSAMINDIGGYAGRMPSVLESHGVKYLTAGVGGFQAHLPWADLPHLFYLKAKDGARTLIWNLGIDRRKTPQEMTNLYAVYGLGALFLILPAIKEYLDIYERGVEIDFKNDDGDKLDTEGVFIGLLERLEQENYPFDEIMLQYGGDNRGPATFLPELVKILNSTKKFPQIELTTPAHFFEYMESRYANRIPELSGTITDPWNTRANPAPVALKKYRMTQRIYSGVLSRLALSDHIDNEYIKRLQQTVEENLQLYGDHTCGLSEWGWQNSFDIDGCRGKAYDRYRKSWQEKAFYADAAYDGASRIYRMLKNHQAAGLSDEKPGVVVWNNSSRTVSGPVEFYFGRDAFPLHELTEQSGKQLPFQPVGENRYLLMITEVPAFGAKMLYPIFKDRPDSFKSRHQVLPEIIENKFFSLRFNSKTGDLLSIQNRATGLEMLDLDSRWRFGEFIIQKFADIATGVQHAGMKINEDFNFCQREITHACLVANGPVASVITQTGKIIGLNCDVCFERELTLYHNSRQIDIKIRMNKPETEEKISCYMAFPFAGKHGAFKFDQNIGIINPATDLLPGAMEDLFYCSRFAAVDAVEWNAIICCPDAPLVQFGGIQTAQWLQEFPFRPDNNHIYGQIYHNLLNTDCPVWQDVLETFEYSIFLSDDGFDYAKAQHDWAATTALSADFYDGMINIEGEYNEFELSPEKIRLLSFRKYDNITKIVLENPDAEPTSATIVYNEKEWSFPLKPFEMGVFEIHL